MKYIYLHSGEGAIVDDADYDRVNALKWHMHPQGYATAWLGLGQTGRVKVLMHRFVLGVANDTIVDHIDRNKLNNTQSNLQIVTQSQNLQKRAPKQGRRFRGVYASRKGWRVSIGRKFVYGFASEEEAAREYDRLAIKEYGKFAYTNFPRSEYE